MKTHLFQDKHRCLCGKRIAWNTEHTTKLAEVTCGTCQEMIKFNKGITFEYKLGGNYDATGNVRKHSNHWSYREENEELKRRLKLSHGELKLTLNDLIDLRDGGEVVVNGVKLSIDPLELICDEISRKVNRYRY